MKVRGLDGRIHNWKLSDRVVLGSETRTRSKGHLLARSLLKGLCPFESILEEVPVPGCDSQMYLDFFMRRSLLAVEVQGEQHRTFNTFFHGTPRGFIEQKKRDQAKREWCAVNGITLVELHDNDCDGWEQRLRAAISPQEAGSGEH